MTVPTNLEELRETRLAAISVQATAHLMGVDTRTVYRAIDQGDMPCVQLGRRRVVPTEPLRRMLGISSDQ